LEPDTVEQAETFVPFVITIGPVPPRCRDRGPSRRLPMIAPEAALANPFPDSLT
jgi:hypothetical protein